MLRRHVLIHVSIFHYQLDTYYLGLFVAAIQADTTFDQVKLFFNAQIKFRLEIWQPGSAGSTGLSLSTSISHFSHLGQ